jgi:shikimate dehydrogenase
LDTLILGSGGSAKGIAYALLRSEFQGSITIASRNKEKGTELVQTLEKFFPGRAEYISLSEIGADTSQYGLIINTTPIGMKGVNGKPILTEEHLNKKQIIFDIVYNPVTTPLVEMGQKVGAKVILGYEMFLYQAIEQFRFFTGISVSQKNIIAVRKLLEDALLKQN